MRKAPIPADGRTGRQAQGLPCCWRPAPSVWEPVPLGACRDHQPSRLVGADGVDEAAISLIALGHPTTAEAPPSAAE